MKPRRLIYLINPISGTRHKESLIALIKEYTSSQNTPFEILPTEQGGGYEFLAEKIKKENITDVVICGGDGSVNSAVFALAKTGVRFGIVPLGSGNGLALAAKIPRSPKRALTTIFEGHARAIDGFMVNDKFACMLCGLGLDATVAHKFAIYGKRGFGTYAKLTTMSFFSAKSFSFQIESGNISFSTSAYFISIANSNQFGNNFTIAPQADLSDGLLDVVVVKKSFKSMLLLNVLHQVLAGRIKKIENSLNSPVIYFQTTNLKVINYDDAPMHIDGEPRDSIHQLDISILPGFFKLIQPL